MPEDDGDREAGRLHQPVDRVEVGRADARAADPDDDAPRPGRLGLGTLDELERTVVVVEERGFHAARAARAPRYPLASASRCSASLVASAMIVSDGFTESVRGTSDPSPTKRRLTSCDSPFRSTTDRAGSSPIRHEPCDVRRHEPGPADLRRARRLEHVPAEPERGVDALALRRLEVDREPLLAVLAEGDRRVVVVVRHREEPDPVPEPPHRLDEARAPERPVLVADRRRERDRVLDRRRLDHEAAVLVVLVLQAVRGDRVDHVRVLRLVEEPVHEPHGVEAEVTPDGRALETRAEQELRRVERPRRDDDRAGAHRLPLTRAVDDLDPRRLVRPRSSTRSTVVFARSSRIPRASASAMYVFIVDLPAFDGQPWMHEPQLVQFGSV